MTWSLPDPKNLGRVAVLMGGHSAEREVSLRKAFQIKNPVSAKAVVLDDGSKTGYIKLSEFNAHDLAITAWAFAKMGHSHEKLFAILARAA